MSELNDNSVIKAIRRMRGLGTDTQRWEVKESVQELPKKLLETISAFSNMHGGTIILGLSEKNGFRPAEGFNADKIYAQMQTIGDAMTPIVRMEIEKMRFEGRILVVAHVPEIPKRMKPCYISKRGKYDGAFIRSGDGDRHLTPYEVDRLSESQYQPQFDIEPVEAASIEDLDTNIVEGIVKRAREMFPRVFGKLSEETILIQLGVLTRINDRLCPTIAGLLTAGTFPQRYFPRLEIVFTVYPGVNRVETATGQLRYLNSKEIVGSIPEILLETLALIQQRMNTGAVIEGGLRKDIPDYPLEAVREAIANALQHRDYSPEGRGSQIQVNMYADRLEIINPGGLYGSTTVDSLGKDGISSTRNEQLSRLLTYTPFESGFVVENKGTGFMVIEAALAKSLMPPPVVKDTISYFILTFQKRRRTKDEVTGKMWENVDKAILNALSDRSSLSIKDMMEMSGLSRSTIGNHIRKLVADKKVEPIEPKGSPKQRYRLRF